MGCGLLFTPVAGMQLAPRLDTLAVVRPAEVILVVRLLPPATLTFRFALLAAGMFLVVALIMHIAPIRQIELAAMLALALRRPLHRQTQEFESPLLQAPSLMPTKISGRDKRKQNKTEQNEEEFLPEASERKSTSSYPIFKPVSSPDFQIVADKWLISAHPVTPAPPVARPQSRDISVPAGVQAPPTGVASSWLFLKDRFLRCESVTERQDGSIVVRLPEPVSINEALLRSFQTRERWRHETVLYAFEDDGGFIDVKNAERESYGGRSIWSLTLQLDRTDRLHVLSEVGFNDIRPDEFAVMRARLLLLNEVPPSTQQGLNREVLLSFVAGLNSPVQVTKGIFPELWLSFAAEREHFLELARLWAVFHLKASRTVEHILDLRLGPIEGNRMAVRFQGQRQKIYANRPASL